MNSEQNSVRLNVKGIGHIPSFKNHKRVVQNQSTGKFKTATRDDIKERMERLENAIYFELLSASQIVGNETHSECWKRLRTVLSGLCDDSIREIPRGEWNVEYVSEGSEGVVIEIVEIK